MKNWFSGSVQALLKQYPTAKVVRICGPHVEWVDQRLVRLEGFTSRSTDTAVFVPEGTDFDNAEDFFGVYVSDAGVSRFKRIDKESVVKEEKPVTEEKPVAEEPEFDANWEGNIKFLISREGWPRDQAEDAARAAISRNEDPMFFIGKILAE